jgi:Plasmid pRiA4b ORF-3-like protein
MVFKFKIISDQVGNFVLHINADANHTFLQLHESLQLACRFDQSEIATFYLADEEWDKILEIPMDTKVKEPKLALRSMEQVKLGELLIQQELNLIYVFDIRNQKSLYIQIKEIETEKQLRVPALIKKLGNSPLQHSFNENDSDLLSNQVTTHQIDYSDFGELQDLDLIVGESEEVN